MYAGVFLTGGRVGAVVRFGVGDGVGFAVRVGVGVGVGEGVTVSDGLGGGVVAAGGGVGSMVGSPVGPGLALGAGVSSGAPLSLDAGPPTDVRTCPAYAGKAVATPRTTAALAAQHAAAIERCTAHPW